MINPKAIRAKRKSLHLSAEALAELLGVKKENIYKWERGTRPSDPDIYLKIETWLREGPELSNVPHETSKNGKILRSEVPEALKELLESNRSLAETNRDLVSLLRQMIAEQLKK